MTDAAVAIYDGLDRLCHVSEESAGRWAAHDADGATVGTFTSRADATDAVIQAAHAFVPTITEGHQ